MCFVYQITNTGFNEHCLAVCFVYTLFHDIRSFLDAQCLQKFHVNIDRYCYFDAFQNQSLKIRFTIDECFTIATDVSDIVFVM